MGEKHKRACKTLNFLNIFLVSFHLCHFYICFISLCFCRHYKFCTTYKDFCNYCSNQKPVSYFDKNENIKNPENAAEYTI